MVNEAFFDQAGDDCTLSYAVCFHAEGVDSRCEHAEIGQYPSRLLLSFSLNHIVRTISHHQNPYRVSSRHIDPSTLQVAVQSG
jgi:hypothetical protein